MYWFSGIVQKNMHTHLGGLWAWNIICALGGAHSEFPRIRHCNKICTNNIVDMVLSMNFHQQSASQCFKLHIFDYNCLFRQWNRPVWRVYVLFSHSWSGDGTQTTVSLKLTKRQRAISWRTSRGLNWEKYKLNRYIVLPDHLVSMDNGPCEKNNNYLSSHEFFLGKNK